MGGADKVLLPLAGKTLLEHAIERLSLQASPLALNTNGDAERFLEYGLPVIPDSLPDRPGPLAGVLVALDWAANLGASGVITVAGDTPFLPEDLAARLVEQAGEAKFCLAASVDDISMRLHPTIGLWPVRLREDLRSALLEGQRKVREFAALHDAETAIWRDTPYDPFFNINTPEDLLLAEQLAAL